MESAADGAGPAGAPPACARAVLVAAGSARRLGGATRKPWIRLGERTLLERVLDTFHAAPGVGSIVVVAHRDDLERVRALVGEVPAGAKVHAVVPGGRERLDSVRAGCAPRFEEPLRPEPGDPALLAIHDVARPFVSVAAVERALAAGHRSGAAVLAVPVRDTLKRQDADGRADGTVERAGLWAAQTPQVFRTASFRRCLARALEDGGEATDDASLWERYEGPLTLVLGASTNFKVTDPTDLELARALADALDRSREPAGR